MADTNKVVQKADERWIMPALISFLAVPPRGAVDGAMQAQDYLQALWAIGLRM